MKRPRLIAARRDYAGTHPLFFRVFKPRRRSLLHRILSHLKK